MNYNYIVTYKNMNKIFFEVFDKYGAEDEPYQYGSDRRTTKIELPMWRYDIKFIKELLIKYELTLFDFTKDDTIFLDSYEDYFN